MIFPHWEPCDILFFEGTYCVVTVVGREKLLEFSQQNANARVALEAWFAEAQAATWSRPQDIKDRYRSADFLPGNRVIFNGNRLVVRVRYQNGIVYIEWVGTYAEYSKRSFRE